MDGDNRKKGGLTQIDSVDCTFSMDSRLSPPETSTQACRQERGCSSEQGQEAGSQTLVGKLPPGSTTGHQSFPVRAVEELGSKVHEAISQNDVDLLRSLVDNHKAPLEERNKQGMTPLYNAIYSNWPDGAFVLLEHGADIHNAESAAENLCSSHKPLIHLALKTGNKLLLEKLIKRGASIRYMDSHDEFLLRFYRFSQSFPLFDCLAEAVTEQGSRRLDLLKDLLFIIRTGVNIFVSHQQLENLIKKQHKCHQSKLFQVLAACLCSRLMCDYDSALHYWKMSADAECLSCQLHEHKVEEQMAPRSVFADIFHVEEHPLPDRVTTVEDKLAIHIHSLLATEKYFPEDEYLLTAIEAAVAFLCGAGKILTAIEVLWRATNIRPLHKHKIEMVMSWLRSTLTLLRDVPEIPYSALLNSMKIIESCLSLLAGFCCETQHPAMPAYEDELKVIIVDLFQLLTETIMIHHNQKVHATEVQLQDFTSHITDILHHFPSTYCRNAFHICAQNNWDASLIKTMVAYSTKAMGTVRQKNCPLHLLSDSNGNTPLHCLAYCGRHKNLVQEGVLQCFLDHGADLCTRNNQGKTVQSILVWRGGCTEGEFLPSLKCLAAATFMGDGRLRQNVGNCRPVAVRNFLLDH